MMKEKQYIDYRGNIKESFEKYVKKPGLSQSSDEFYGKIKDNSFWFYKPSAWGRNSFRTFLQGEIIGDKVYFNYRKARFLIPAIIFSDLFFAAYIAFVLYLYTHGAGDVIDLRAILPFVVVPILMTTFTFIYPRKEKEQLYENLQRICWPDINA